MSELKVFDVGLGQYCEDGSPCVVAFDADKNPRLLNEKVYLKSEADNVIAELKAREDVLVTDNRNLLDKVKKLEERLHENAEHFKRNELQILENSDKVIAEKDKEIQRLENLCESYRIDCDNLAIREANAYKEIGRDNKKIIHQKHKRCLAMARICYMKSWSCLQYFTPREKYDHWKKWQKRWTELANKFKEANDG